MTAAQGETRQDNSYGPEIEAVASHRNSHTKMGSKTENPETNPATVCLTRFCPQHGHARYALK